MFSHEFRIGSEAHLILQALVLLVQFLYAPEGSFQSFNVDPSGFIPRAFIFTHAGQLRMAPLDHLSALRRGNETDCPD